MEVNELRIGNMIDYGSIIGLVSVISKRQIVIKTKKSIYKDRIDEFSCIILNDQWLLDFGFEKKSLHNINNDFYFIKDGLFFCEHTTEKICYENRAIDIKIKYVHQWQNLYYTLTNKELTIKNNQL